MTRISTDADFVSTWPTNEPEAVAVAAVVVEEEEVEATVANLATVANKIMATSRTAVGLATIQAFTADLAVDLAATPAEARAMANKADMEVNSRATMARANPTTETRVIDSMSGLFQYQLV